MERHKHIEKILWSIALPGFAQLLNGKFLKGITFIFLEVLINIQSNLNEVIIASFYGNISKAIQQTNYGWLMFYPCVYLFAIWDGYKDAGGEKEPYSYMPFVSSAYMGTIGVIYSPTFKLMGVLLGPIWLSILFLILGVGIGLIIKQILIKTL